MVKDSFVWVFSHIYPSYKYERTTAMTKETILKTIDSNIGSVLAGNEFHGETYENGFKLKPHTKGRNTISRPIIEATIKETEVSRTISYHIYPISKGWCVAIPCFFAAFFILSLSSALFFWELSELINALLCLLLLVIFECVIQLPFRILAKIAMSKLDDLLIL